MTPSTPAPTDAGALADREELAHAIFDGLGIFEIDPDQRWAAGGLWPDTCRKAADRVAALRNSAPQETRGDEPVGRVLILDAETRRDLNGVIEHVIHRRATSGDSWRDIADDAVDDIFKLGAPLAPQQSPRLEREGIARIIDPGAWELKDIGYTLPKFAVEKSLSKADAILALLSPDTSVVPSPEREPGPMVPWELDCRRAVCAAPECECPAVSSTSRCEVGK